MTEQKESTEKKEPLAEGTLLSHLVELRRRLLIIAVSVVAVFIILLPFSRDIFSLISEPLRNVLPGNAMIATAVASPLMTPFKLTFFTALFVAMPVVLFQIWAFIAPGLYKIMRCFVLSRYCFCLLCCFSTNIHLFYISSP